MPAPAMRCILAQPSPSRDDSRWPSPLGLGSFKTGSLKTWPIKDLAYRMKSLHFSIAAASVAPQGMMGTDEVEFFGEPSISLSEYTM
jgi:hypothetical protein